jgi:ABC-type bacteriocin/lantibiotic exporter with double-glycine peptidase domain
MYRRPEVLVMDESTSALDNRTEAEVMREIQELKAQATLVIIAHRLTTVQSCDRIYLLEHGRIVNVGSYEELKATSEVFRDMINGLS